MMAADRKVGVRLGDEYKDLVIQLSRKLGIPQREVARRALEYLGRERSLFTNNEGGYVTMLSINMNEVEYSRFRALCERHHLSMSNAVELAVARYARDYLDHRLPKRGAPDLLQERLATDRRSPPEPCQERRVARRS